MRLVIDGVSRVFECLDAGIRGIEELHLRAGAIHSDEEARLGPLCQRLGVRLFRHDDQDFKALRLRPEGCRQLFAIVNYHEQDGVDSLLAEAPLPSTTVLALDGVTDPGNLGAVLRSALWFGVKDVILPRNNSAAINDTVMLRSAGALAHLRIHQVNNLPGVLLQLREVGFRVLGTVLQEGQELASADLSEPLVIVLGSEGRGMRRMVKKACDLLVTLPGSSPIGSLNVSAFAAVILYQRWTALHGQRQQ